AWAHRPYLEGRQVEQVGAPQRAPSGVKVLGMEQRHGGGGGRVATPSHIALLHHPRFQLILKPDGDALAGEAVRLGEVFEGFCPAPEGGGRAAQIGGGLRRAERNAVVLLGHGRELRSTRPAPPRRKGQRKPVFGSRLPPCITLGFETAPVRANR